MKSLIELFAMLLWIW